MTLTIIKIVAVVVILAAMLLILLGIGHLISGDFSTDNDEIDKLRSDVTEKEDVVSPRNSFHTLISESKRRSESLGKDHRARRWEIKNGN